MAFLYDGYCYSALTEIGDVIRSEPSLYYAGGVAHVNSYTVTATALNLTYYYKPFSATAATTVVQTRTPPYCSDIGYSTNYSSLSLTDVTEISFLVVLAWAIAFGFKVMRRAL